jgi:hypothetical protein
MSRGLDLYNHLSTFRDNVSFKGRVQFKKIFKKSLYIVIYHIIIRRDYCYNGGNLKSLIVYEDCNGLFNIISYIRDHREGERFE